MLPSKRAKSRNTKEYEKIPSVSKSKLKILCNGKWSSVDAFDTLIENVTEIDVKNEVLFHNEDVITVSTIQTTEKSVQEKCDEKEIMESSPHEHQDSGQHVNSHW